MKPTKAEAGAIQTAAKVFQCRSIYYTDTVATHICLLKQFAASKQSKAAQRKCPPCYYHLSVQDAVQTYSDGCDASPCTWSLYTGPALRFSQTGNNKTGRKETRARRAARLSGAEVCRESASQTARRRNWGRFFSADRTMMWPGRGGGPGQQSERLLRGQIRSAIHGPKKERNLYIRLKISLLSTMWHQFLVH